MKPEYIDESAAEKGDALEAAWRQAGAEPAQDAAFQDASRAMRQGHVLHPGEIVAERYQLIGPRGEGSVASIWLARDLQADRAVSLKVLHARFAADALVMARFMTAAENGVCEAHRREVVDLGGQWAGFVWFAVAGKPGVSLEQRPPAPDLALQAVIEIGGALARAHERLQLHGAVQPNAIRLDAEGSAWLDDFGLVDGPSAGTWAAPELLAPGAEATAAADVYGFAMCALYALNGGPLPFWAWRDPERLVDEVDLPAPAAAALKQAVQWSPELRPESVQALLNELLSSSALRKRLADACLNADRPGAALAHLDWMVASGSNDPALWTTVARARAASGQGHAASAWQVVLDHHRTPGQAKGALRELVELAKGHQKVVVGCELLAYLEPRERPELQRSLGQILLDLGDPEGALPLLEAALAEGEASPELLETVEHLRTLRGDWTDALAHLQARIDGGETSEVVLRQARSVARFAVRSDVSAFDRQLVEHYDDPQALAALADAAVASQDPDAGEWLQRLSEHASLSPKQVLNWIAIDPTRRGALLPEALAAAPQHIGLRLAMAQEHWTNGAFDEARSLFDGLNRDLSGSGFTVAEATVSNHCAELAWLAGDWSQAAEIWQAHLDRDGADRAAWWGLARVALWANDEAAWLTATPEMYTPEEALARLLSGLVSPEWVLRFLAREPLGASLVESLRNRVEEDTGGRLRAAAVLVVCLQAQNGVGPALFESLADAFPEAGLAIEAVRWMWCEPATDLLFAIPDSYRWCGQSSRFDPRVVRRVLPLAKPLTHDISLDFSAFEDRDDSALPIEEAWNAGTPVMAPERPGRWVLVADVASGGRSHLELDGERISLGGSQADTWVVPGLTARRVVVHRILDRWYLLADPAVYVDSTPRVQWRLMGGERILVDGIGFASHWLASGVPVPAPAPPEEDDLELDLVEEWTDDQEAHAVLVEVDGTRRILFAGDELSLGPDPRLPVVPSGAAYLYRLRRTDGGYTLEDRVSQGSELPPILPLFHGDAFELADATYRFEVYDATATSVGDGPSSDTDPRVPMLIIRTGGQSSRIVISGDLFTIGRGQGNDLQLSNDSQISRHHCSIVRDVDGACILKDAGSANGTLVGGNQVDRRILQVGDLIQVGAHALEFDLGRLESATSTIEELFLDDLDDTTASRAETAAFRRPIRRT